jgi:hypothetical protein
MEAGMMLYTTDRAAALLQEAHRQRATRPQKTESARVESERRTRAPERPVSIAQPAVLMLRLVVR